MEDPKTAAICMGYIYIYYIKMNAFIEYLLNHVKIVLNPFDINIHILMKKLFCNKQKLRVILF